MALTLIEGVVDAVKSYLTTDMPAKLNALDSEYDDGIVLDDIKTYYIAEVQAIPEYPSIFLLGDDVDILGEGGNWLKSGNNLDIIIFVGDQNTTDLRRRIYRYVRALIELLITARTSQGWAVNFKGVELSPMYSKGGDYLSDAHLSVQIVETNAHAL